MTFLGNLAPGRCTLLIASLVVGINGSLTIANAAGKPPTTPENGAASLFESGAKAHRQGDYAGAARLFDAAHTQVPSGAALYNAGRAWQLANQPAPAADRFVEALNRTDLNAIQMEDAARRLSVVRRLVAQLNVSGSAAGTLSVAHVSGAALPAIVHVPPGEIRLSVTWAAGGTSTRTLKTEKGDRVAVFIEAPVQARQTDNPDPGAREQKRSRDVYTQPSVPAPASGLKFFFRAALGPGMLWDSLEQSLSGGLKAQGTAVGGTLENELAIGVSVNQTLVFGLAASTALVSEPKVSFPNDPDLSRIGSGVFVLTGPFVIWYLGHNHGWHVQGMLGGAALNLSDPAGSPIDNRILGSGLLAALGYDWWLSDHWRSGVALRATAAGLESTQTDHALFLISLQGSITWDSRGTGQ